MTNDSRSPAEIEREIERERAGLAHTLDDLQNKFSVETMARQVTDQFREHGGDIGRSVTDAVKRNPVALALTGALIGNVVISAAYTAGEFDTSTVRILSKATQMTWPVFFAEAMTAADYVSAAIGARVAAFFANRRLSRGEYFALRQWQDQGRTD